MASPLQVANDLRAQARALERRYLKGQMPDPVVQSLERGARTIEQLVREIVALKAEGGKR